MLNSATDYASNYLSTSTYDSSESLDDVLNNSDGAEEENNGTCIFAFGDY